MRRFVIAILCLLAALFVIRNYIPEGSISDAFSLTSQPLISYAILFLIIIAGITLMIRSVFR